LELRRSKTLGEKWGVGTSGKRKKKNKQQRRLIKKREKKENATKTLRRKRSGEPGSQKSYPPREKETGTVARWGSESDNAPYDAYRRKNAKIVKEERRKALSRSWGGGGPKPKQKGGKADKGTNRNGKKKGALKATPEKQPRLIRWKRRLKRARPQRLWERKGARSMYTSPRKGPQTGGSHGEPGQRPGGRTWEKKR